ncbi:nucleoside ABC transporter membrane protein [Quadrisphaera granulorum]|uniref:Nucleoside ABC transporter membrane protein n=1 Tax=Quadrisphaera granulorum TaxID=317664 RepID=A0A315ZNU9_9ACTN|nr:ABC transporter permease [Quadrisphaera granulorum]PWJ47295.1 nucleoside ABC transporter membrane protein [Quadrisphaera granulorum]SZE98866.1 nucleoside ABC transporter membrane protein [Quadrisphaera granulorum]
MKSWLEDVRRSSWLVSLLAVVVAFVLGGVLIALTDPDTQAAMGYFFARPTDAVSAGWRAATEAYGAMLRGAIYDPQAATATRQIRPITETLTVATPLIAAGLGVALAFRVGLFNIGAQGQLILGVILAGWVGFRLHLPVGIHLLVAVLAAVIGGALWGGLVGVLRARTGAPEVITTIMLNYVALYLLAYLLTTGAFQREGASNPISPPIDDSAAFPLLLGDSFRLHLGFLVVLVAAAFVWWLLERSTVGFRWRAVGANPAAARTAGMSVSAAYVGVMVAAGALAGLAGAAQLLGTEKSLTGGIAGSIGPDAITVALLGRSRPLGVVLAGLLFGALRAGGVLMQAQTGTPIDIVLVVQSVIVLLIAAPPLVRSIFRLEPRKRRSTDSADGAAPTAERQGAAA